MKETSRVWGAILLMGAAGACSQELSLPEQGQRPVSGAAGAADDGFTGTAGADDDDPTRFGKLPVLDTPSYWPGGAGGEAAGDGGTMHEAAHAGRAAAGAATGGRGGTAGSAATAGDGGSRAEAGAGGSGDEPAVGPPRLIFSEYVEGSSTFKALEIYALTRSSLEGCELLTYTNGESDGPTRLALHGTLEAGETQVLCTSKLMMSQNTCDRSAVLSFNGDDAVALVCGDMTLDVLGQIGFDPGSAWGDGATVDHTLRRRCSVELGRTEGQQPFDPQLEWLPLAVDTFTGLGEHTCTLVP